MKTVNNKKGLMSNQNLVKTIKEDVERVKETENYSNLGKAFDFWILTNYFEIDEEIATTNIIDSPNDKNVDAFIEEEENIKIIQCKFFNNIKKEVGGDEIALFKGCLDWLNRPDEVKKLNLFRLYDLSSIFSERWKEGIDIQLHFFAFGKFSSEAMHERIVFNNSEFRERVQMYFHDIDDILKIFKAKSLEENPLANEKFKLELIQGEYFIKEKKIPSIVATVKGKDLLKLYEKYGDSLFERNIRYYRGARKESINAKIIDTILTDDKRENFWYYNNGISFVCQDFNIKDDIDPPILEVKGFQVINGCQTTVCLSQAKEREENWVSIPEEVQVIVRFIKAPIKDVGLITLYTNSQNPVNPLQLKSNDPLQKRLQEELNSSSPYFYSIKEGDWQLIPQKLKKTFKDRIELAKVTQAIYSFNNDPVFARRWKNKLFSEKYNEIFRKDISKEEIILPWIILKVINIKISQYRKNQFNKFKKEPNSFTDDEKEDILRKEFLIYSNLIILHFIGRLIRKYYREYSNKIAKKLLNKRLQGRIERIFDYIIDTLKYSERLKKEKGNLYHFLLNFNNVKLLYDEIQSAMDRDKARNKKEPLKDFLPEI